jgi:hypothetical protein
VSVDEDVTSIAGTQTVTSSQASYKKRTSRGVSKKETVAPKASSKSTKSSSSQAAKRKAPPEPEEDELSEPIDSPVPSQKRSRKVRFLTFIALFSPSQALSMEYRASRSAPLQSPRSKPTRKKRQTVALSQRPWPLVHRKPHLVLRLLKQPRVPVLLVLLTSLLS